MKLLNNDDYLCTYAMLISVVPLQGLFTKLICMPGVNSLIPRLSTCIQNLYDL